MIIEIILLLISNLHSNTGSNKSHHKLCNLLNKSRYLIEFELIRINKDINHCCYTFLISL